MSDKRRRAKIYPFWLNGIQITQPQQDFINTEIKRRGDEPRQRNGIIRDVIDFTREHYDLFLTWIASRGTIA